MKTKAWLLALMSFCGMHLFAQKTTTVATGGQTTFGIQAGINFQNINGKDFNGNDLNYDLKTGFHAGVNAEVPVGTGSYLQPGLLFSQKGAEVSNNTKIKTSYLEVPVNFVYKPLLGTGNLLLGFGPYIAFGIGGNYKSGNSETDIEFVNKYNPNNSAPQLKRFDAGGNLLAGYELLNGLSFQLNAQLGMVKINPEIQGSSNDNPKMKNTGFGLSVGYRLRR